MQIEQVTYKNGSRVYKYEGKRLPSVTTILKGGVPAPALVPWAARVTAEFAADHLDEYATRLAEDEAGAIRWLKSAHERTRDDKADLGTALHTVAEAHSRGDALPEVRPDAQPYVDGYLSFVDETAFDLIYAEPFGVNATVGYAGSIDFYGRLDGRLCVMDYKTSKACYPTHGLQVAAYANVEWLLPQGATEAVPMEQPECGYVLRLTPEGGYELHEVNVGPDVLEYFIAAKKVYELGLAAGKKAVFVERKGE